VAVVLAFLITIGAMASTIANSIEQFHQAK